MLKIETSKLHTVWIMRFNSRISNQFDNQKKNYSRYSQLNSFPFPGNGEFRELCKFWDFSFPFPLFPGITGMGTGIPGNFSFPAHLWSKSSLAFTIAYRVLKYQQIFTLRDFFYKVFMNFKLSFIRLFSFHLKRVYIIIIKY